MTSQRENVPVNNTQVLRNRLDHGVTQIVVHVHHLEPLGELIRLHIADSLPETKDARQDAFASAADFWSIYRKVS